MLDLTGRTIVVTGGAGLLGPLHAEAVAEAGGNAVLLDIRLDAAEAKAATIGRATDRPCMAVSGDVTNEESIRAALATVIDKFGRIDGLINNAANDPKTEPGDAGAVEFSRVESFPLAMWQDDLAVGLTGAFICAKVFGGHMANVGGGSIVNIASDLSIIAPDQRLYRLDGVAENQQPVKPASYSAVKAGLVGLTKYLATYWATSGVRVNAVSPAGIRNQHDDAFVSRLSSLIPMNRMGCPDELKGAIVFLCSDASSFVTGHNLAVDGGRTVW